MISKKLAKILIIFIGAISVHNTLLAETDKVIVAGGCFWCVEADFEGLDGVKEAVSGYTGGTLKNPSYKQVVQGGTGHYEAVEIEFDSSVISLDKILYIFLRSVDVTDDGGQFCDRGESYRTAIFTNSKFQNEKAQSAIKMPETNLVEKLLPKYSN